MLKDYQHNMPFTGCPGKAPALSAAALQYIMGPAGLPEGAHDGGCMLRHLIQQIVLRQVAQCGECPQLQPQGDVTPCLRRETWLS